MRSKYGNRRVRHDGILFDSVAEYRRYCELRLLEKAGKIIGLEVHSRIRLLAYIAATGAVEVIGHYVADFEYKRLPSGEGVIEDVKGVRTAVYRLKKKIVEANYGIKITEVKMR